MSGAPHGFAARLRRATSPDHEQAESSSFLDRLLAGELDVAAYRLLTVQHREIYRALEVGSKALRHHPVVAALHDPALERTPSLEADLAWLRQHDRVRPEGQDGHPGEEVLPETRCYADRIDEVVSTWPGGFVAHHYTRYLGDLSGGLQVGRRLEQQLDGGTSFYRFDGIPRPKRFKDAYRAALDAAVWDEAERARIVAEVSRAYALNRSVLAALGKRAAASLPPTETPPSGWRSIQQ